jgi:myo-inositol-1(or 4)-monophosphatase
MAASALMTMMLNAARKAGRHLARDFGEVEQLQVSRKGPGDFVTAADMRAEQVLYDELAKARHGYSFLMEERGIIEGPDKSHFWIVDPLDGTMNFMHGIPHFAISIGLQREGELVAGLIYNPANGDVFTAEKGKGAFLNDRRIRVAARSNLEECVIVTGIPHHGKSGHESYLQGLGLEAGWSDVYLSQWYSHNIRSDHYVPGRINYSHSTPCASLFLGEWRHHSNHNCYPTRLVPAYIHGPE